MNDSRVADDIFFGQRYVLWIAFVKKLVMRDIVHKITLVRETLINAAHWRPQLIFIHLQASVNITVALKKISQSI